jgi:class 3 adenylate cyclase
MRCPSCGGENAEGAKFCEECRTLLKVRGKPEPTKRRKGADTASQSSRPTARSTPARPQAVASEAERRQLTVMFCDLVGSTALSAQLDPEEYREVVRTYQQTSAAVIDHFEGYIAQYLGDGLLVYFGYPSAHEDNAARAVRVGLRIIEAMWILDTRLTCPLHVRLGIHTGPVVVDNIGGGRRQQQLALDETPNLAACIQGQAAPDEVVISAATYRLVEGLFACEDRCYPELKGVTTPFPWSLKGRFPCRTGAESRVRSSRVYGAPLALRALPHSGHIWERLFASFLRHHSHRRSAN